MSNRAALFGMMQRPALTFSNDHSGLFNGITQSVNLGTGVSLTTGGQAKSWSGWFYPTSNILPYQPLVDSSQVGQAGESGSLLLTAGGNFIYQLYNSTASRGLDIAYTGTAAFVLNAWNFFVISKGDNTAANFKIYMGNGGTVSALSLTVNLNTLQAGDTILLTPTSYGYSPANSTYFAGNMTQMAIWNRALSSSDVTALYNAGTPTDLTGKTGLTDWYQFSTALTPADQPTGTIYDRTGANNGTTVNTTSGFLVTSVP